MPANPGFELLEGASMRGCREQRAVNVFGRVAAGLPHDHSIALLSPFQHRAWSDAEVSSVTSRPLLDYLQGTVALKRGRFKEAERFYARSRRS